MLHQRGAALHPIAVVTVEDRPDPADLRLVNVAADDSVDPTAARLLGQGELEIVYEIDCVLDAGFQIGGQRPIGVAEAPAPEVVPMVEHEEGGIGMVPE